MSIDTAKWRACAPLLPDGGCEAVRELCDEIEKLRDELAERKECSVPTEALAKVEAERDAAITEIERLTDAKLYGEKVCAALVAERDAALARVAELEADVVRLNIANASLVPEAMCTAVDIECTRVERNAARAERDSLRAKLAEVEAERDAAKQGAAVWRESIDAALETAVRETAERIAQWLESDGDLIGRDIAADIRSGAWRGAK